MPGGPENGETPAMFLQDLGAALAGQKDVDAELAKILAGHILQDPQHPQSVADAARAIAALAAARAKGAVG